MDNSNLRPGHAQIPSDSNRELTTTKALAEAKANMTVLSKIEGVPRQAAQLPIGLAGDTNVRTPCGPRRVENLRPGDLIVTRKDGLQPVRMIWKRTISATEVAADPSLAPVIIKPRAVGPMMPQSTLRLAAAHGMLLPGYRVDGLKDTDVCMVRARDFAQMSEDAMIDRRVSTAEFYNLVFDNHQLFAANGLMVESFLPTPVSVSVLADEDRERLEEIAPGAADGRGNFQPVDCPLLDEHAVLSA